MAQMSEFSWAPGATNANTPIDLPATAPNFHRLTRVEVSSMSDGTVAGASATKTIVTAAPGAGEARLNDENTVEFGDALTARNIVRLVGEAKGTYVRVS